MSKVYKVMKGRVQGTNGKYYKDEVQAEVLSKDAKRVKKMVDAGIIVEKKFSAPAKGK